MGIRAFIIFYVGCIGLLAIPFARAEVGRPFLAELPIASQHAAKDCGEIRLDKGTGPLVDYPVRDQVGLRDCQSHAAAALLEAHRRRIGISPQGSGYFISPAAIYAEGLRDHLHHASMSYAEPLAGTASEVIQRVVAQHGVCDENLFGAATGDQLTKLLSDFQDSDELLHPSSGSGYRVSEKQKKWAQDIVNRGVKAQGEDWNRVKGDSELRQVYLSSVSDSELRNNFNHVVCDLLDMQVPPEFIDGQVIAAALSARDDLTLWNDIIGKACAGHRTSAQALKIPKIKKANLYPDITFSPRDFRDTIDKLLTKNQPISMNFCSAFLLRDSNDPIGLIKSCLPAKTIQIQYNSHPNRRDIGESCAPHSAVVIGRKWDAETQKCRYLVHNSWGTDCGIMHQNRKAKDCENGKVWMDETDFRYVLGVDYLDYENRNSN